MSPGNVYENSLNLKQFGPAGLYNKVLVGAIACKLNFRRSILTVLVVEPVVDQLRGKRLVVILVQESVKIKRHDLLKLLD